ncbi:MAG TPA: Na/Pi cotransporter family protein, partial [Rhodospirillaceae bacterium]|nr:Na/Pi cotransporter family protein [Rhodospirillaceae bacterium]
MDPGLLSVLGGIGLFLIGMKIMTEALRDAAGPGLRHVLTRFTTTPLRGALTGLGATAVIQSSTATTVMTVGFVGAGVMTFPQALGVLYGANIGTTVTGWIVAFLGLKLKIGVLAQPVLFAAALIMVLGRGRAVRVARGVAGMAMLFLGLDLMAGAA